MIGHDALSARRCQHCPELIWHLPKVPLPVPPPPSGQLWEDDNGLLICRKRAADDSGYVYHQPMPTVGEEVIT